MLKKIGISIALLIASCHCMGAFYYEWQGRNITTLFDSDYKNLQQMGIELPAGAPERTVNINGIIYKCYLGAELSSIVPGACLIPMWHTTGRTPNFYYAGPAFFIPQLSYGTPQYTALRTREYMGLLHLARSIAPYNPPKPKIEGEIITKDFENLEEKQTAILGKVVKNKVKLNRISKSACEQYIDIIPNEGTLDVNTEIKITARDNIPVGETNCVVELFWSPDETN